MSGTSEVGSFLRQHKVIAWLCVVPIVVIFTAYFLCLLTDDGTRKVAIVATTIAAASFLNTYIKVVYDILEKVREQNKKSIERLESIRATPVCNEDVRGNATLGVELYNNGMTEVNIRNVSFHVVHGGSEHNTEMRYATGEVKVLSSGMFTISQPVLCSRLKLGIKDYAFFRLEPGFIANEGVRTFFRNDFLSALQPECLWMFVISFAGPVTRVSGVDILKALHQSAVSKAVEFKPIASITEG